MIRALLLLLAVLAAPAWPGAARAEPADIDAAARGVVRVVVIGRDGEQIFAVSHGTGFAVGPETIVTNAHVVAEAVANQRLSLGIVPSDGGEAVFGRLVAVSERNDLALIRTTSPMRLPPLTIAGGSARDAGTVTSVGYPQNVDRAQGLGQEDIFRAQPPVKATGFLSGTRPSREFDTLLHTAPIARGSSGGPLLDECGRVIGVNSFGAVSAGADAEFFFAVSARELIPFLRANDVSPQVNTQSCRSLAELEAEERAREQSARAAAEAEAAASERARASTREETRRGIEFALIEERDNLMALAFALALGSLATGAVAWRWWEIRAAEEPDTIEADGDKGEPGTLDPADNGRPAYAPLALGALAMAGLAGAAGAWFARPEFSDVEVRLEAALRAEMRADERGPITAEIRGGSLSCTLEEARSRVTGAPMPEITLDWGGAGCVNGRTQYALSGGEWTRVFVPASEAAVSVNRFDPASREFVIERYLLGREAMGEARSARASFNAPACAGMADEDFATSQADLIARLPDRPNERLVYRCAERGGS